MLPATGAVAQALEPFRTSNLSPPLAIIGLPVWSAVPATTRIGIGLDIANHYRLSQGNDDALLLDGETSRLRAFIEKPVGDRWSWAIDVPIYRQSGGVLDDVVDSWHSAFGMPDGGRNYRPEDRLEFRLADEGGPFYELLDSSSGLGDMQVSVAGRFGASDAWTLRGTLKLPTGEEDILAGSGATDVTLTALRLRRGLLRGREASYFLGGAWLEMGEPEIVEFDIEDRALAAVLGGALSLGQRYGIKGQIDANTPLYDSDLEEIGQTAAEATIGGWLRLKDAMTFEFAVSEDLHVSTSPDVVIVLSLSTELQ